MNVQPYECGVSQLGRLGGHFDLRTLSAVQKEGGRAFRYFPAYRPASTISPKSSQVVQFSSTVATSNSIALTSSELYTQ